jgi:phenylpropionate dioxygenase-like ring-hydroxylating dioxygenase large terminal subunit
MGVLTDELLRSFDDAVLPVGEAKLLPPDCYTSPEFYEFERQAIFDRDWICVGREDQVANSGDFITITLFGEPLLVARDKAGQVNVMSAVCRHRGAVVTEEAAGNCSTFRCMYHHWTYGLDGALLGCPAMEQTENFVKTDNGLVRLPVELWQGFIFTNFDPNPKSLVDGLVGATELLTNYDLEHAFHVKGPVIEDLPWNWKVMIENFNDGSHADRLHQHVGAYVPCTGNEWLDLDNEENDNHNSRINWHNWSDASFNPTLKNFMPVFSGLTEDERKRSMYMLMPPTLGLAVNTDMVVYFIIAPLGPGQITLHVGFLFDPTAPENALFEQLLELAIAGVNNFNRMDILADTLVQRGLSSTRFAPRGRYSYQEESLVQFNRWLVRRYQRFWPSGESEEQPTALRAVAT